ncbi:luc7-like protein 3 isoform X2 [Lingula anatina]|uniref:Luc7-like protein 3 isoform X2 n=1 Tax=Lingula anatina TaxID=7574 RepID=A0A1S3H8P1_LINAN|nr:luc7-like protein 3 isoform X2 [Lingula anatina]|eukprot:XP_013381846.1 luc7-like protein 3 isoform X2 [Lingula anatina]
MAGGYMAQMLDELMGRNRNLDPSESKADFSWDSPEVCKHFLCGFCPCELFINTRADLGQCNKIHDEDLKRQYSESPKFQKMGFEEDFERYLNTLVADVERRIRRGHQRLSLNNNAGTPGNPNPIAKDEKIKMLTERINDLVEQAENLGCEGKVEEAQGVLKLCEQLREERTQLETSSAPDPQFKQMEVCDVCGAFLIVGDAQQRLEEHLMGKQHMGYARVRATLQDFQDKRKKVEIEREERLRKEREEREKEREKEREERRRKEKEREDSRRRRSRSRDRERRRSRSRERRRRSRSRDRHSRSRRSRSRERRRSSSRSRSKRSRSRSRGHKSSRHRSRSRERERSRRGSRERSRERDRRSKENVDEPKPDTAVEEKENGIDEKSSTAEEIKEEVDLKESIEVGSGDKTDVNEDSTEPLSSKIPPQSAPESIENSDTLDSLGSEGESESRT